MTYDVTIGSTRIWNWYQNVITCYNKRLNADLELVSWLDAWAQRGWGTGIAGTF